VSGRTFLGVAAAALAIAAGTATAGAGPTGGVGEIDPVDPPTPEYPTDPASPREGVFPVVGRVTYGDGLGSGRGHQGIDLMAKCGKRVVAALPGRVSWIKYQAGGAGHYVVIDGKGRRQDTVYMHLAKRPKVRKGQKVAAGQTLGRVGSTGNTTACHLHFEMWSPAWSAGKPINPKPFLRRWKQAAKRR